MTSKFLFEFIALRLSQRLQDVLRVSQELDALQKEVQQLQKGQKDQQTEVFSW